MSGTLLFWQSLLCGEAKRVLRTLPAVGLVTAVYERQASRARPGWRRTKKQSSGCSTQH